MANYNNCSSNILQCNTPHEAQCQQLYSSSLLSQHQTYEHLFNVLQYNTPQKGAESAVENNNYKFIHSFKYLNKLV